MGDGLAAITQGWSPSSTYQQLLTLGWVPNNLSKCRMETLKLSIRVLAGRALKISNRVSIRALKLSNFERFRTLKISNRVL